MTTPATIPNSTLSHYLTENHLALAQKNERDSTFFKVAMVVSALGAMLIFGGVTAMYLGLFGEVSMPSLALLGCMIGSAFFMKGVDTCAKWHVITMRQGKWYRAIDQQLKNLTNWTEERVRQFFTLQNRSLDRICQPTLSTLQKINPAHPLLAFLPLIARYQLTQHYAAGWNQKAQEQIDVLQNIDRFSNHAKASILQIHRGLLENALAEKARCEKIMQNYLLLVV